VERAIVEAVRGKLRQVDQQYDQAAAHKQQSASSIGVLAHQQRGQSYKMTQMVPNVLRRNLRRGY
jgi:hypothetical protein